MSEHQERSEMMGQLVHRGRGEPVARAQAANESRRKEQRLVVMNGGVPEISREGITAMLRADALKVLRYIVKSVVPANAFPASRRAADRVLEPVFVVMNILQRDGFG